MNKGKLYMIPVPVADNALQTLSPQVAAVTADLRHYFAENVRTARRFLRSLHPMLVLEEVQFSEIDKHTGLDVQQLHTWMKEGRAIGVLSEAGCPGIADPGADIAAIAQGMGIQVVPLTGPSSILLALMASGLNGQSFAFSGYLPVKDPLRSKRIKELELLSGKERQTQAFIETPYRNDQLLAELLKLCAGPTRLCIARDITGPNEYIRTRTISDWKKNIPVIGKEPAVFLLLA